MGNAEQAATINFPESRRVLGHVNHTILGSTVDYPSDSSASCNFWHLSNLNTVINQHYQKLHTVHCCFTAMFTMGTSCMMSQFPKPKVKPQFFWGFHCIL